MAVFVVSSTGAFTAPRWWMSARSVLIVDDEPQIRHMLDRLFAREGWAVLTAADGDAALALLHQHHVDAVITDVRMPGMNGIELTTLVHTQKPAVAVVVVTGYQDYETVRDARLAGALRVFGKPLEQPAELLRFLNDVLSDRRRRAHSPTQVPPPGTCLVGSTRCMVAVYERIVEYAQTDYPVLVMGENGTGKEVVAAEIHRLSLRSGEKIIFGNCAAIPRELQESHMFGHRKGSFTGAIGDRQGWFEHTGGGTVVLDEVGDAAAELQAKLLRVLESREFYPVGSHEPIPLRARIISATNQDLHELVRAGRFREDLYHRLAVLVLCVPPLRERLEDIPLLAAHFLGMAAAAIHCPVPILATDARDALTAHNWPGNVRELRNCMTRSIVHANGSAVIRARHLEIGEESALHMLLSLEDVQREHIQRVLRVTGGNRSRAAEILGISRQALYGHLPNPKGSEAAPD